MNQDITCMSFNVLGIDMPNYAATEERAIYIAEYLQTNGTDLIGLQEAGSHSYDWTEKFCEMVCANHTYAAVKIKDTEGFQTTINRTDGKTPNSAGLIILYRAERFELLSSGAQRYTSTERQVRYFQWVKLIDKQTKCLVYMTNTHWSIDWDEQGNVSALAGNEHRTKQAKELQDFWENTVGKELLFATGDYNCVQDSDWIVSASGGIYKDANTLLGNPELQKPRIDYIFINTCRAKVEEYAYARGAIEAYSDHKPLIVKVSYENNTVPGI